MWRLRWDHADCVSLQLKAAVIVGQRCKTGGYWMSQIVLNAFDFDIKILWNSDILANINKINEHVDTGLKLEVAPRMKNCCTWLIIVELLKKLFLWLTFRSFFSLILQPLMSTGPEPKPGPSDRSGSEVCVCPLGWTHCALITSILMSRIRSLSASGNNAQPAVDQSSWWARNKLCQSRCPVASHVLFNNFIMWSNMMFFWL